MHLSQAILPHNAAQSHTVAQPRVANLPKGELHHSWQAPLGKLHVASCRLPDESSDMSYMLSSRRHSPQSTISKLKAGTQQPLGMEKPTKDSPDCRHTGQQIQAATSAFLQKHLCRSLQAHRPQLLKVVKQQALH